jgi:hypothetical protein
MGFGEETSATAHASHSGAKAPEKGRGETRKETTRSLPKTGRGDACVARGVARRAG